MFFGKSHQLFGKRLDKSREFARSVRVMNEQFHADSLQSLAWKMFSKHASELLVEDLFFFIFELRNSVCHLYKEEKNLRHKRGATFEP